MTVPSHLLHAVQKHGAAGRSVGLVIRHAERHHVLDLYRHEEVLLTERGHHDAKESGGMLAKLIAGMSGQVHLHHSPVERCGETARAVAKGLTEKGIHAEVKSAVPDLASPFLKDKKQAYDIVMSRRGHFIREWFDGGLPEHVFEPKASAARAQLRAVVEHIRPAQLSIFVSHDWNIALLREAFLDIRPETTWPGFLDGIVVATEGDDVLVELDGHVVRHRRPT